jgi:hypothetical protein
VEDVFLEQKLQKNTVEHFVLKGVFSAPTLVKRDQMKRRDGNKILAGTLQIKTPPLALER